MSKQKHPIALNLPKIVAALIVFGRYVVQSMADNAKWFVSPIPALADVTTDLDELEKAEAAAKSRAKGAAAIRDESRKKVEDDLKGLAGYAQGVVAKNPGKEAIVIAASGMAEKHFTKRQKLELEAVPGVGPLALVLRAKAVGKRAAYEWQMSSDGGKTWVPLGTTTVADTSVSGLASGTTYLFRFRVIIRRTPQDWSQVISYFMH